jgi:hypothetical protein
MQKKISPTDHPAARSHKPELDELLALSHGNASKSESAFCLGAGACTMQQSVSPLAS